MAGTGVVQNFYFDKEAFADYMQEQSCLNFAIINSGIIVDDPKLHAVSNDGNVGTIPFFNNIDNESDALNFDGKTDNVPSTLTGGKQTYMAVARMKAWKDSDFVRYLTGKSPLQNLASNLVVPFYTRTWQRTLLSILKGVLSVEGMEEHITDLSSASGEVTEANELALTTYLDAQQKAVGENHGIFSLCFMHSVVLKNLKKKELIEYRKFTDPNTLASYELPVYGNMIVMETDTDTVDNSGTKPVYLTYMAGRGAFLGSPKVIPHPYETDYDAEDKGGINKLYTKQARVMHPNGFSVVIDNIAEESPTDAELATPANWNLRFNHKVIALACIKSNG